MLKNMIKRSLLALTIITAFTQMANADDLIGAASSNIPTQGSSTEQQSNGLNLGYSDPSSQFKAGQDYLIIKPAVPVSNKDTVEVINFFSYGCKPCSDSMKILDKWKTDMPYYARLIYSPISPNNAISYPARVFFTLQKLNKESLNRDFMDASISGKTDFSDFKILHSWLASRGVNTTDFDKAFDSNEVVSKVYAGPTIVKLYNVRSIPAVVVNGHYLIPANVLKDEKRTTDVLNYLVGVSSKENKNAR